jgi:TrmH family RNA methyltransferase
MLIKSEVKYIQSLAHQKGRNEAGCFLAEGVKLVEDLLCTCPTRFEMIYATEDFIKKYQNRLEKILYKIIEERDLNKISCLQTPNHVVAVLRKFESVEPVLDEEGWVLALDGIQNPGNLGAIIRNADWFGVKTILCSEDTVDCYNPKVIQASMGSIARVSLSYLNLSAYLSENNRTIYGASLNGTSLREFKWAKTGILVLGGEGYGIRPELIGLLEQEITIGGIGGGESLNVAVASAIFLWEMGKK